MSGPGLFVIITAGQKFGNWILVHWKAMFCQKLSRTWVPCRRWSILTLSEWHDPMRVRRKWSYFMLQLFNRRQWYIKSKHEMEHLDFVKPEQTNSKWHPGATNNFAFQVFYFQFRLKMRFPWWIHFEGSKMSILLRLSTNILTGFLPDDPSCVPWNQRLWAMPGYFEMVCEGPGPISFAQHWVLGPGCFPWNSELLGNLFQSPHFQGGLISSSLLLGHHTFEFSERVEKQASKEEPWCHCCWGNLWPIILEPMGNTIYRGEKNQYCQGLL